MTSILPSLRNLLQAALRPRPFFMQTDHKHLLTPAVVGIGVVLLLGMLLMLGTAMIYFQDLMQARAGVVAYYTRHGVIPLVSNPSPWRYLSFPIVWAVGFAITAALRFGAMALFGDSTRNYLTLMAVSIFGLAPLVVIAILHGVGNNLFPFARPIEDSSAIMIRSYILIGITLMGIVWEAVICIRAFQIVFLQNAGRAVLTWLTPWFALIVFYATLRFIAG